MSTVLLMVTQAGPDFILITWRISYSLVKNTLISYAQVDFLSSICLWPILCDTESVLPKKLNSMKTNVWINNLKMIIDQNSQINI